MRVLRVAGKAFGGFEEFEQDLPDLGLVVVTGPNGHGKSTLAEAVALGLFDQSLRGANIRHKKPGQVQVRTDELEVTRSWTKGGTKKLTWNRVGEDPVPWETMTKANQALREMVGSYEVWRRCSVFTSSQSASFAAATDAQRKALLESLLGVDKFDAALKQAKDDLNGARIDAQLAHQKVSGMKEGMEDAEAPQKPAKPEEERIPEDELEKLRSLGEETREVISKFEGAIAEAREQAKAASRMLKLLEKDSCPTCQRPIDDVYRHDAEADAKELKEAAEKRLKALERDLEEAEAGLERDRQAYREKSQEKVRIDALWDRYERDLEEYEEAKKKDAAKAKKLKALQAEAEKLSRKHATLEAVTQVLGVRGVRTTVLGKALDGLEASANEVLGAIFPGVELMLSDRTEKKTGGIADKFDLKLDGAAGGDYQAASQGQRRRIDIALLLALADMSDSALGTKPGTVFFDEVFDALDEEGVDSVSGVLAEMAKRRPVLVVSHMAPLVESLLPTAVAHLHVRDGRIHEQ